MANVLHPNAKTTPRVRKEIQESKDSAAVLAKRYNVNIKTIYRWRKADSTEDAKSGPRQIKSSLIELEQQIICEVRRVTKLPLNDLYTTMKPSIPALTRSNLHRLLCRNNLNELPKNEQKLRGKNKIKNYKIGFIYIDIIKIIIGHKKKLYVFVAIDRSSKYIYLEVHDNQKIKTGLQFLENTVKSVPFKIYRISSNSVEQFTDELFAEQLKSKHKHPFDELCEKYGMEYKPTKLQNPWNDGQVKIFDKTLGNPPDKEFYYEKEREIKQCIMGFLHLYNFQYPLHRLEYLSPIEYLCKCFNENPELFRENPNQKIIELNG